VVKDYIRLARLRAKEVFVPLAHPPGHSQVDFGEAIAVIGGVRQKIHVFFMDAPHSDAPFMKAYPAVAHAVTQAIKLGALGFDAVKQLILCRIEKRPPRLDVTAYPYLPKANVGVTRAADYVALLERVAA
jgi:hypothetical protein